MREFRPSGSVRGAVSNHRPYRDLKPHVPLIDLTPDQRSGLQLSQSDKHGRKLSHAHRLNLIGQRHPLAPGVDHKTSCGL